MDAATLVNRSSAPTPLPMLARWTAATLVGAAAMMTYLQVVLIGQPFPPLALIFGLPALLFAIPIVASRWRWAPLLAVLYWGLSTLANAPFIAYDLLHPEFFHTFAFMVILQALTVVGLMASLGTTRLYYRAPRAADAAANRRVPGWFSTGLVAVAGLTVGTLLVAAIAGANPAAGVSAEVLADLPKLSVAGHAFEQPELRVKAGETVALSLENSDAAGHSFDLDEFNVHVPMPPGEPSLALFRPDTPGRYTFYCGVPGHRDGGMVGTLIVEP